MSKLNNISNYKEYSHAIGQGNPNGRVANKVKFWEKDAFVESKLEPSYSYAHNSSHCDNFGKSQNFWKKLDGKR
jgi:hypothetical protein